MTSRERALAALNHKEPDRVPIDFGSTRDTSIVLCGYEKLKKHFGIGDESKIANRMMQIVDVNEKILEKLHIDFRPLNLGSPDVGQDTFVGENKYVDEWGVERVKPIGGFYFDQLHFPLSGEITVQDLMKYPWPDPNDKGRYRGLKERALALKNNTDQAIVLNLPAAFIHTSQYLRGFEDWFVDLALDQKLAGVLFDIILEINMAICENALHAVGEYVDVISTSDDLGLQEGLMINIETYRKLIKPRHEKFIRKLHSKSGAKVFFHSCGAIMPIMGDLIDIGVDILNPVQVSAKGMDPAHMKKLYGDHLVFWGGIDTQNVLPNKTEDEVRQEVARMIGIMGENGGYVLSAVHNIQPDVPVENILAMYDQAVRCGNSISHS